MSEAIIDNEGSAHMARVTECQRERVALVLQLVATDIINREEARRALPKEIRKALGIDREAG